MDIKKHAMASAIALLWFLVMTVLSASWDVSSLVAAAIVAAACSVLYFHYRRRTRARALRPTTPDRDDRVIPRDIRVAVIARDGGKCQLRYPGICLVDKDIDIDHIWPWSQGGSSKDMNNLQCACHPCNVKKGASLPVS